MDNQEQTGAGAFAASAVTRQIGLLLVLAGTVALGVTLALWIQKPNFTLLYGSLSGKDAVEVLDALRAAGITYQVDESSGAILVPTADVHEARLKLAANGLPHQTDMGFQLLDKERTFGTSQFIEHARYQRALEVELARSIATLNNVSSARIHLALPKQSAFLRASKKPSASVLIKLHPGRKLEDGQGGAIAHLVAASIPELEPSEVRVVNERGRLLTPPDEDALAMSTREFDFTRRLELAYIKRIEGILGPMVGPDGMQVQVTAAMNFTRLEETTESFQPDPDALRSEYVVEELSRGEGDGGVPGALSNQPPPESQVPETLSGEVGETEGLLAADGSTRSSRRQSTKNFELNRSVQHKVQPSHSVQRLSVAVVVDHRPSIGEDGVPGREARSGEEMERITALVKEAIGFDAERGDSVQVINAAFSLPEVAEELEQEPLWKQPWVLDLAKQIGGGILVLILAFGIVRPTMRNLTAKDAPQARLPYQGGGPEAALIGSDQALALAGQTDAGVNVSLSEDGRVIDVEALKTMVSNDPKRVAGVVQTWMKEENG